MFVLMLLECLNCGEQFGATGTKEHYVRITNGERLINCRHCGSHSFAVSVYLPIM